MIQNNGLTLDLLLGLPKTDSVVGQVAATEMRPFSELLASLTSTDASQSAAPQPLFNTVLQGLGLTDEMTQNLLLNSSEAVPQSVLAEMFNATDIDSARLGVEMADNLSAGAQDSTLTVPVADLLSTSPSGNAVTTDISKNVEDTGLPFRMNAKDPDAATVQQMLALLTVHAPRIDQQTAGIDDGTYTILDARVMGDRISLTLQSQQSGAQPIEVSLPVSLVSEMLAQAELPNNTVSDRMPVRVALDESASDKSNISALLAKLNLRELQVETSRDLPAQTDPTTADETSKSRKPDVVTLTFRSGQTAEPFTLGLPVNRRTILTHTRNSERIDIGGKSEAIPVEVTGRQVAPKQVVVTPVKARAAELTGWTGLLDADGDFDGTRNDLLDSKMTDLTGANRTTTERFGATDRLMPQSVRFTLPDQIAQQLKPNGRSISISIEPEHLGKATLRLSMHNQMLTARLTVDTPAAKAMVEQSLDQLSQQLARAGVKVDLINVNVAGGDAHTNMFGQRQPAQFARSRVSRRLFDRSFAQTLNPSVEPSRPAAYSYVGPAGVNVFA